MNTVKCVFIDHPEHSHKHHYGPLDLFTVPGLFDRQIPDDVKYPPGTFGYWMRHAPIEELKAWCGAGPPVERYTHFGDKGEGEETG